ncbi:MAG: glycosyltransferase family 2 protein [Deltaproteobacteria bacterium]|nr:glycosyltransferase family 2 protein [Deltaproteobacteria bacterium]MBW2536241.1 glycosyltransferase family 2 protein [Deltaproteobacteria bacterium]
MTAKAGKSKGRSGEEPKADAKESSAPELSLVVPGLNEAESLPELARQIHEAIGDEFSYELVFVDDGSTDDTWKVIRRLKKKYPTVRGIRLRDNFGKAQALSAGFSRVRGRIVVTMDADLQDDPEDLPSFLEQLDAGLDVVVGWKVNRLDPLNRRVLSKIFNGTVAWMTGVKLHDMNCGFKAYRREVIRSLPIYGDIFRFIPVLAKWRGFRVGEVPVKHHARQFGRSRYGLERILRGLFDMLTVMFLTRYSSRPMHLFGFMGLLMGLGGFGVCTYLTVLWAQGEQIGSRPLLLLGVLLIILGIQFFSMGLIGEFLTFTHQRRHDREEHPICDELE